MLIIDKFIKEDFFLPKMDLEGEMEQYGAFQEGSLSAGSAARPTAGNINALVTSAEPCECLYGNLPEQKQYRIPRATENPAVHRGMLRRWIRNFHQLNGMPLPRGFYQRTKPQLRGMYYGMLKHYEISVEQITGPRY